MVIFLYGPDSYRRNKKVKEILDRYKEKHSNSDIESFDFSEDENEWKKMKDFVEQPSMFTESKLALVQEGTKVDKKGWIDLLKEIKDNKSIFIVISDSTKKPKKKFKFLLKEATSQEFKDFTGDKLRLFLRKQYKQENITLTKKAEDFLVSYIESQSNTTWCAVNEIKKISLSNFETPVSKYDLESIILWIPKGKMFNETRKLFRSGVPALVKLPVLEQLINREETDSHVFNLLGYQAKGSSTSLLADLDIQIKSGELDYEEALLSFVLKLN